MSQVDLKVVILGMSTVGKTSLLKRYINETFDEKLAYQNTIGGAYASKTLEVGETNIVLGVWDTAGSERYHAMVRIYYRGAKAAIICYEITNKESFNWAKYWVRELRSVEENCKIYVCATKKDLLDNQEPSPDLDAVQTYVNGIQSKFFITSSKTGENVAQLFQEIAKDYVEAIPQELSDGQGFIVLPVLSAKKRKTHCCR